jgi:hypothetical protein
LIGSPSLDCPSKNQKGPLRSRNDPGSWQSIAHWTQISIDRWRAVDDIWSILWYCGRASRCQNDPNWGGPEDETNPSFSDVETAIGSMHPTKRRLLWVNRIRCCQ